MYSRRYVAQRKIISKTDVLMNEPEGSEVLSEWLSLILIYMTKLLNNGITPITVFDGKNKPEEKVSTWEERQEKSDKAEKTIIGLKEELSKVDPLANSEEVSARMDELRQAMTSKISMSKDDPEILFDVLRTLGFPCIEAVGEAEQLCAILAAEGVCEAALSADSDVMPFGTPIWIMKIEQEEALVVDRDEVIKELNLHNFRTFVDFCILSGCDYNYGIKQIASMTALDLMRKHRSIEGAMPEIESRGFIENDPQKGAGLKHVRCRELFAMTSSANMISDGKMPDLYVRKMESLEMRDLLQPYRLNKTVVDKLIIAFQNALNYPPNPSECRFPFFGGSKLVICSK
jgi:5'-3' exonuclease